MISVTPSHQNGETKVQKLSNLYYDILKGKSPREIRYQLISSDSFASFRREAIEETGMFWRFPPFGADDIDFCIRFLSHGWDVRAIETGSAHYHRSKMTELMREMYGWGKGHACFIWKHENNLILKNFIKTRKSYAKLHKTCRSPKIFTLISYLSTPISWIPYLLQARKLQLYFFVIIRNYSFLLGYMWGWLTFVPKMR